MVDPSTMRNINSDSKIMFVCILLSFCFQVSLGRVKSKSSRDQCLSTVAVSRNLWTSDDNRMTSVQVKVNYQSFFTRNGAPKDRSRNKLFTYVDRRKLSSGTYTLFRALLNNYDPVKGQRDTPTSGEVREETAFMDAILNTKVMETLLKYAKCRGWARDKAALRQKLKSAWFQTYSRSMRGRVQDTSGFEHVMVGEYKNGVSVNGFHNWVSFYENERAGKLNYYGYIFKKSTGLMGAAFKWNNRFKDMGSFLIGVSPELDMALYSLAFWNAPRGVTPISLGGQSASIRAFGKNGHIETVFYGK